MTASFQADPGAIAGAGKKFAAEVDPINTLATRAESLHFSSGNAGKAYAAQGTSYHAAMLTFVQKLCTPWATKTTWAGDALDASARDYRKQDSTAQSGVNSAGRGA